MTDQRNKDAWASAAAELAELAPLKELAEELRVYPVRLLSQICGLHEQRKGPVPDHALTLLPYLGETALRSLVDGGYVQMLDDVSYAIHAYVPTDTGMKLAASLTNSPKRTKKS